MALKCEVNWYCPCQDSCDISRPLENPEIPRTFRRYWGFPGFSDSRCFSLVEFELRGTQVERVLQFFSRRSPPPSFPQPRAALRLSPPLEEASAAFLLPSSRSRSLFLPETGRNSFLILKSKPGDSPDFRPPRVESTNKKRAGICGAVSIPSGRPALQPRGRIPTSFSSQGLLLSCFTFRPTRGPDGGSCFCFAALIGGDVSSFAISIIDCTSSCEPSPLPAHRTLPMPSTRNT